MTSALMEYLDAPSAQSGGRKYVGAVASGYDEKREHSEKWEVEQKIIEEMLSDLPAGSVILDAPCGTGRFFPFYEQRGFVVCGLDASADMLRLAARKIGQPNNLVDDFRQWTLAQSDVRNVPLDDKDVDAAVNCRITRWLSPEDCQRMIREMQRVARKKIIFTARIASHPHARPLELFQEALDGWKIARNAQGYIPEYRIIELRPA